jgi:hypothetical protein
MKKVRCRLFSATLIWLMEVNVNSPDNYACRWRREPSVDLGDSAPLVPPATDQGSNSQEASQDVPPKTSQWEVRI